MKRRTLRVAGWMGLCLATMPCQAAADGLESVLGGISPEIDKWATVVVVSEDQGRLAFEWHHYRDSKESVRFWPASTIKLYAIVAGLEYLNELGFATESVLTFQRQDQGIWKTDAARTMPEMISEVFRRSANEDYTLLLRFVGIDRINTRFLIPARGFPHSALMRGYVRGRPYAYEREQPQRITIRSGDRTRIVEHTWSGTSYAEQRGATVLSSTTGNCTSTQELAECLRRLMFHEHLSEAERYRLTPKQLRFVREGADGMTGLRNQEAGAYAWKGSTEKVFPQARYYHKGGLISTYSLDLAYIHDEASGCRYILAIAAHSGETETVTQMAASIARWMRVGSNAKADGE